MNMAANIARLRRERGMTQEALAEMVAVSPQTVSKWENGVSCPDVMLQNSRLFERRELQIDEAPLVYYELTGGEQKLYLLYAALTFAEELAEYQGMHYCFFGNMEYFSP